MTRPDVGPDDPAPWLALRDTPGLRGTELRQLLGRYGTPAEIFGRPAEELARHCGGRAARALAARPDFAAAREELARARAIGLRCVPFDAPDYPALLAEIPDPPPALYLRGSLPEGASTPMVAIVGARRASTSAKAVARRFAAFLARAGAAVVSGLAYGVDAAAHAGALDAGGASVAVLASGLDRPSPAGNVRLARRLLEGGGAWLSEYPPGTPALAHHFPRRNRLISGLARATLIVEARERSGTLWTAGHAVEQGRDVLVVPGPIDTDRCRGSNALIRDGAIVVLDERDLAWSALPASHRPVDALDGLARAPLDASDFSHGARRALEQLADGPLDADALARGLGLGPGELAPLLLELELAGAVLREGSRVTRLAR